MPKATELYFFCYSSVAEKRLVYLREEEGREGLAESDTPLIRDAPEHRFRWIPFRRQRAAATEDDIGNSTTAVFTTLARYANPLRSQVLLTLPNDIAFLSSSSPGVWGQWKKFVYCYTV